MLLPTENMAIRRSLDQWLEERGIRPRVVGEFEDGALLREFGTAGHGVFVMPTMVEKAAPAHLPAPHRGAHGGRPGPGLRGLGGETHQAPAVAAICDAARTRARRQKTRRFSRSTVKLAVSATAITAITPACTGSVTTRSAASGTLPAMLRLITSSPCARTSRTAASISPPMSDAGEHEGPGPRQAGHRPHRLRERLLAHEGDRVHRDVLAADVVAVGLGDGADRHLADLGPAAHDDDPLAVDALEGLDHLEREDRVERAQVGEEGVRRSRAARPRSRRGSRRRALDDLDGRDVAPVAGDHPRQLVEDARSAPGADVEAEGPVAHDPGILP